MRWLEIQCVNRRRHFCRTKIDRLKNGHEIFSQNAERPKLSRTVLTSEGCAGGGAGGRVKAEEKGGVRKHLHSIYSLKFVARELGQACMLSFAN